MENKTPQTKIKSSSFLIFFLLFVLVVLVLISIPKENWKKIFSIKSYNLATVYDTPESLGICTNGDIRALTVENSILYYGGSFSLVGNCSGSGVPINISGTQVNEFPKVTGGIIYTAIGDESGGWYVGGSFTQIGSDTRNMIAHIFSDGTLDANFNPGANGSGDYLPGIINSLTISGSTLYVGGSFTTFGGNSRAGIAAYDLTNNVVTDFNPGIAGPIGVDINARLSVNALLASSSTLYVGGSFTTFGGLTRHNLAAYDLIDATTTSLNPGTDTDVGSSVDSLAISSSTLYVGGYFTKFGSSGRRALAAYDLINATTTSFYPKRDIDNYADINNHIYSLVISGSTLYIGGSFGGVGYPAHSSRLAAIDLDTEIISDWNPAPNGVVYSLFLSSSTLYVGGAFTSFDGLNRSQIAVYDLINATTTDFNAGIGGVGVLGAVRTLFLSGNVLYTGGGFSVFGGINRNQIAAYDLIKATTTDFNPGAGSLVQSLTISDSILYVGGLFTTFGGLTRNRLAAYDLITATTTSFNPNANNAVSALVVHDSILYIGGSFWVLGGLSRNYGLAAYDLLTNTVTDFNPGTDDYVGALAISNSILYVGGRFTTFGGLPRSKIAAYDIASATTTSFNPGVSSSSMAYQVTSIVIASSTLYAGGIFTTFGGLTRNNLAAYDIVGATTTSFNPNISFASAIRALTISDSTLYAGGTFTSFGGLTRNNLAAYDLVSATTTSFAPNPANAVYALTISDSNLYMGGSFKTFSTSLMGSIISVPLVDLVTLSGSDISTSTATLKADIVSTGGETVTARGFRYDLTGTYANNKNLRKVATVFLALDPPDTTQVVEETGTFSTGDFSTTTTGLAPDTTYHYQAFITTRLGTTYSDDSTFTTLALASSGGHRSTSDSTNTETSTTSATSTSTASTTLLALETSSSTEETSEQPTATSTPDLPANFCFTKNFHVYTTDSDIKNLQIFLNSQGFNASTKGSETTYYGLQTISAVKSFQEYYANETLTPFGLTEGTGNFGNATRKKANDILGCQTISEVSAPVILKVEIPTTPENTIPEVITNTENQTPTQAQQNETSAGTEPNQNVVPNIGESTKQGYEQVISIAKDAIANTKAIVNTPAGSAVTKVISTAGIITGATISISAIAFATPISFSEIWLIPARLFGLLMGALGIKRKQRQWGTVYDSVTKRPLDPVYVSLINTETNKEVVGAITDIDGRYGFLTLPGKYKIVATKTNYIQPSVKMAGKVFDEVYNDLYFGEEILVTEEGQIITKNIPMDALKFDWNEFAKTKMDVNKFTKQKDITWAKISSVIFFIGAIVAFIAVIFAPAPYNFIIAGFYIVAYILNYVVLKTKKSGTLTEKHTGAPLSFAIVSIFREGETTPLTKKIADKFGAYYALLPNGKYYMKVEKKNDDGTYTEVFKTEVIDIKTGVINMNFVV